MKKELLVSRKVRSKNGRLDSSQVGVRPGTLPCFSLSSYVRLIILDRLTTHRRDTPTCTTMYNVGRYKGKGITTPYFVESLDRYFVGRIESPSTCTQYIPYFVYFVNTKKLCTMTLIGVQRIRTFFVCITAPCALFTFLVHAASRPGSSAQAPINAEVAGKITVA